MPVQEAFYTQASASSRQHACLLTELWLPHHHLEPRTYEVLSQLVDNCCGHLLPLSVVFSNLSFGETGQLNFLVFLECNIHIQKDSTVWVIVAC